MLRAAALVPPTALLVLPGVPAEHESVREDARSAVRRLVACGAGRIVVVVPAGRTAGPHPTDPAQGVARRWSGRLHPTLVAAGVPDAVAGLTGVALGVSATGAPRSVAAASTTSSRGLLDTGSEVVDDVPAAVGLALLADAGWTAAVEVVAVVGGDVGPLQRLGRSLATQDVALLLMGGLSARRGPGSPLAEDPRAAAFDESVAADLALTGRGQRTADLGTAEGAELDGDRARQEAVARLAAVDPALAEALAVSAWGPWQVLLGALGTPGPAMDATVRVSVPAGATYAVATWDAR